MLQETRVFVPSKNPSPAGTELSLDIVVPGIEGEFIIDGLVIEDPESGEGASRTKGMLIAFSPESPAFQQLKSALQANDEYREKLGPEAPPAEAINVTEAKEEEEDDEVIELGPAMEPTPEEEAPEPEPPAVPDQPPPEPEPPPAKTGPAKIKLGLDDQTPPKVAPHSRESIRSAPKEKAAQPQEPASEPAPPEKSAQEQPEKKSSGHVREYIRPPKKEEEPKEPGKAEPKEAAPVQSQEQAEETAKAEPAPSPEPRAAAARSREPEPAKEQSALKLNWIKDVIAQEEMKYEEEEEAPPPPPPAEKKELTPEERERVKPCGDFIMDLAKAMLRSGYYAPDHPGAKDAKQGLFDQLKKALGDSKEIMLTNQETRERTDVLITGVLEEPVSVRTVVGAGMAELFVPRLRDYYNRKGLVSFALKKDITADHFDAFVDIMSDPKVDRGENAEVGQLLTNALVSAGISEISTVFVDDMIILEEKLPWRAEMALHRLAKDLKVLPMFKGRTAEEMKALKVQIVQDIIRPLRHPFLLKDIVLNCYLIAKHVQDIEADDLEQTVIASFPMPMLLPTSRFIFEEMSKLKVEREKHPDSQVLNRRFQGVKRILKWIAQRVVMEDVQGAKGFLEQLYFNEILSFEELPPEVQYRVNTLRLAEDVRQNPGDYALGLYQAATAEDAAALLKCFHRVVPVLMEQKHWAVLLEIAKAVDKAAAESKVFLGGSGLPANPLIFIFYEYTDALVNSYGESEKAERQMIDELTTRMGPLGVEVFIKILTASEDRSVRKAAVDSLIKRGDLARRRVRQILDDPRQVWFLQRNALLVLGHIGQGEDDVNRARRFVKHSQPKLREEALNTALKLEGKNAEPLVIAALHDPDKRVQRRALGLVSLFQPPSEASILKMLEMIKKERPEDKDKAVEHDRWIAQLMRSLGAMADLPNRATVEDAFLQMAKERAALKTGLFQRFRKAIEQTKDEPVVMEAAIDALGRMGEEKCLELLDELVKQESPHAKIAKEAADRIRLRIGK